VAGSCKQRNETFYSKTRGEVSVDEKLLDSQEGFCSLELVNWLFSHSVNQLVIHLVSQSFS
jgi:hypothetical protein